MRYFDKNGVEIKTGMIIRMEDGSLKLVCDATDSYEGTEGMSLC